MARIRWATLALALALVVCLSPVAGAAAPKTETEIPVIPGAALDQEAAARWNDGRDPEATLLYSGTGPFQVRSRYEKVYTVPGPIEDVFRFYQVQLGAKPLGADDGPNPLNLDPGQGTPVFYDLYPYEEELTDEFDSSSGITIRSGKFVRESLTKNRRPYAPGQWIREAEFNWGRKEGNGDVTVFMMRLEDWSFSEDWRTYKTKTLLVIHRETYVNDEEARNAANAEEDEFVAGLAKDMAAHPPTEALLGAPLYPGATFMPEASAGMTMENSYAMYIYLTADPTEKVAAFYQQKTGKQAESWEPGRYLLALAGQAPMPDKGISIEPNQVFGGPLKTVITFVVKR